MLGITALSQSPIASLGGTNVNVAVTGLQLTSSIGASTVTANANVSMLQVFNYLLISDRLLQL
jgi:hypothetical protein